MKWPALKCPFCGGMIPNPDMHADRPVVCPNCAARLQQSEGQIWLSALAALCISLGVAQLLNLSGVWFVVATVLLWPPALKIWHQRIFVRMVPPRLEAYVPKQYKGGLLGIVGRTEEPKAEDGGEIRGGPDVRGDSQACCNVTPMAVRPSSVAAAPPARPPLPQLAGVGAGRPRGPLEQHSRGGALCPACHGAVAVGDLRFSEWFRCGQCGAALRVSRAYTHALVLISVPFGLPWLVVWAIKPSVLFLAWLGLLSGAVAFGLLTHVAPRCIPPRLERAPSSDGFTALDLTRREP